MVVDDMNNSNSLAQATIWYAQLRAIIDMNDSKSWA